MSENKRFIHFGCWNNSGCDYKHLDKDVTSKDTALTRVMKKIKKNIDNSICKPEFISIAGDNYYPIIKENTRILDEKDLISGFISLPKDIKKYILLGNHDLEKISNRVSPSMCQILDMQKELEENTKNNFEMDDLNSPYIMNAYLSNSTIVIMIDTSMYSNEETRLKQVTTCYQRLFEIHHLEKINDLNTIEKVRKLQEQRIETFIVEKLIPKLMEIKNIIIIGHHPLICFNMKENNINKIETLTCNDLNKLLYNTIYSRLKKNKNINYYYLCADLHQYQTGDVIIKGNIKSLDGDNSNNATDIMHIKQYITGTGGSQLERAEVDLSQLKINNKIRKLDTITIKYNNVSNIATYGFLDCILTQLDEFKPVFISANMRKFNIKTFKSRYSNKKNTTIKQNKLKIKHKRKTYKM